MPNDIHGDPIKLAHAQEVLDHFEQIEGRFKQVSEGLTHLQRLATLGTLSSAVAHEFNNVLTPVIGYLQMALANPQDGQLSQKALEKALFGTQRAAHICSSLLDFSQDQEADPSEPQGLCEPRADLRECVDAALACLAKDPQQDGIEFRIDLVRAQAAISPISLQQVLLNLILNAKKAMGKTGGVLTILSRSQAGSVHIQLTDTGGGIAPEITDRLFEPFATYQLEPVQGDEKGSGLGLYICKDLIARAGGEISFESMPGKGTTFHISIPAAKPLRKSA
jgi:signal transduction histidine kinase